MARSPGVESRDRGAVLPIALVFVVVLSLVLIALARLTSTNLSVVSVTRDRTEDLYVRDAGIEIAIQALLDDAATTLCENPSAGVETVGTYDVNGASVTVTCETTAGGPGASGGGAPVFVATGYTYGNGSSPNRDELVHVPNDKGTKIIVDAWAYNFGGFKFAGSDPELEFGSDLLQHTDKCMQSSGGTPTVVGTWSCNSDPVPDPNPDAWIPTDDPANPQSGGTCDLIFYPGRYDSDDKAKLANFQSSDSYYFASGVYYFEDVDEIQFEGLIHAGAPGGDTPELLQPPCADDAIAESLVAGPNPEINGSGVVFVFGRQAWMKVASNPQNVVEMFSRQTGRAATEGTAMDDHTLITITSATTTTGAAATVFDQEKGIITSNPEATMLLHGTVYMPTSHLEMWGLENSQASSSAFQFGGGLVFSSIEIGMDTVSGTVNFAAGPSATPSPRTTVVVAMSGSGRETTAVVTIDDTAGTLTGESWFAE
ncbi:MAG: hypothetical protein QNJ12_20925 [Ilumatobacter sp.]|uniref:hypothetical protein n=1 Tax=Ilumatobacter sp. TaxID=1967498 RepID=UPI00261ACBED|nr:hypothetical protein [Ilumatobacter sp.]MDJ0771265.1 hypothetical protein [Ilumatobacter sp.]